MSDKEKKQPEPPEINPYLFPLMLGLMGLWCLYDGWFTTDPEMQEHLLFNKVCSVILLVWCVVDFFRTWRAEKRHKAQNDDGEK